ncbi:MAG: hypothetical protein ACYCOR_20190 [Acidobacteriaceae bacterium]
MVAYAAITSIFGLFYFGSYALGVNLIVQGLKLALDTGLVLFVIFGIDYSNESNIRRAVKIAFAITVLGIILNDLHIPGLDVLTNNPVLHQTPQDDPRWRGMSKESGVLAPLIMGLGLLSAHYSQTAFAKGVYWTLSLSLMFAGGSKGGFLCMLGVIVVIFMSGNIGFLRSLILFILSIPIIYFGFYIFLREIPLVALIASNSIATRLTMQIWSCLVFMHFPLGVGFTGFLPALRDYLFQAADTAQAIVPFPMNFTEVYNYQYSAQDASSKSLLGNFTAFFGFPFLYLAMVNCIRLVRVLYRNNMITLLASVLFMLFALCTYADSLAYYNFYIIFGIAIYEYKKSTHTTRPT